MHMFKVEWESYTKVLESREAFEKECDGLAAFAYELGDMFPPGVRITSPDGEVVEAPWLLSHNPYNPK